MATTNQLVDRAKVILSRTNDSSLAAKVITELQAAQERLEAEAWLPDFLFNAEQIVVTDQYFVIDQELERYIRLHDRMGGLYVVLPNPEAGEDPNRKLKRFDTYEQMIQLYPGPLESGAVPAAYCMVDRLVYVRPYPSVAIPATLSAMFYQGEASLPEAGNSTLWTTRAADYLLGEAGQILAQTLRDKEAQAVFAGLRERGKRRLQNSSQADEQADQEYVMGDRD